MSTIDLNRRTRDAVPAPADPSPAPMPPPAPAADDGADRQYNTTRRERTARLAPPPETRAANAPEMPADTETVRHFDVVIATSATIDIGWGDTEALRLEGMTQYAELPPVCVGHSRTALPVGCIMDTYTDGTDLRAIIRIVDDGGDGSRVLRLWDADTAPYLSVGYRVTQHLRTETKSDWTYHYDVTEWTLMEVSVVSVPADPAASQQRAEPADPSPPPAPIDNSATAGVANTDADRVNSATGDNPPTLNEGISMDREQQIRQLIERMTAFTQPPHVTEALNALGARATADVDATLETVRAEATRILAERAATPTAGGAASAAVGATQTPTNAPTPDEAAARSADVVLDAASQIGSRVRSMTAISFALDIANNGNGENTGAHREFQDAIRSSSAQQFHPANRSCLITPGMMMQDVVRNALQTTGSLPPHLASFANPEAVSRIAERMQTVNGSNLGSDYVDTLLMANLLVPHLFSQRILQMLGLTKLMGLQGNLFIPTVASDVDTEFQSEVGELSTQQISTNGITITPTRIGTNIEISELLMLQSSISAQSVFSQVMMESIEVSKERSFFQGTGANNQPQGIFGLPGTLTRSMGVNGGKPTYQSTLAWSEALETSDIPSPYHVVMSPGIKRRLRGTPLNPQGGDRFILELMSGGSMYPIPQYMLDGAMASTSNLTPITNTKGSASNLHALLMANFGASYDCMWGNSYQMIVDHVTKAKEAKTVITLNCFYNFGHSQPQRILVVPDIDISTT